MKMRKLKQRLALRYWPSTGRISTSQPNIQDLHWGRAARAVNPFPDELDYAELERRVAGLDLSSLESRLSRPHPRIVVLGDPRQLAPLRSRLYRAHSPGLRLVRRRPRSLGAEGSGLPVPRRADA